MPRSGVHTDAITTLTERQLIEGCRREDRTCQRALFRRYAVTMLGVCRRYARHEAEAEDLLQDAFIRVFNKMHTYRGEGSLEGWIRRVVVNVAIRNYRKSSFQRESIGLPDYEQVGEAPTALDQLSADEIRHEIAQLPEGYRVVFNLFAVEGYSHREIAELLDCTESTSRTQLRKARLALQIRLQPHQKKTHETVRNR